MRQERRERAEAQQAAMDALVGYVLLGGVVAERRARSLPASSGIGSTPDTWASTTRFPG